MSILHVMLLYSWIQQRCGSVRTLLAIEHSFPMRTTRFIFNDDVGVLICNLIAMGSPTSVQHQSPSPPATSVRVIPTSLEPSTSGLPQQTQFSARKTQSCYVKIVQASIRHLPNGKMEFIAQNQTFVDVTEATANLHYVISAVQRKWGQDYVLVTSDGLKVDDSSWDKGYVRSCVEFME